MVNWQQISLLESVTDMWLTLRDWILDLRNRSPASLSIYKAESRRLSKLMQISWRQYESKLADEVKSNPRRFFAHVRRNRRLKQRIMALLADYGAVLTDSPNMARKAMFIFCKCSAIQEILVGKTNIDCFLERLAIVRKICNPGE